MTNDTNTMQTASKVRLEPSLNQIGHLVDLLSTIDASSFKQANAALRLLRACQQDSLNKIAELARVASLSPMSSVLGTQPREISKLFERLIGNHTVNATWRSISRVFKELEHQQQDRSRWMVGGRHLIDYAFDSDYMASLVANASSHHCCRGCSSNIPNSEPSESRRKGKLGF